MKLKLIGILTSVLAITALNAAPEARNLSLKVKVEGKASYDNDTINQTRKLLFNVSLSDKEPAPDLVLKWVIYGHAKSNHDPVAVKSGELTVAITPGQAVALESPQITITGVREHSVSTGSGRRRKSKKVPASGQEYFGYSAILMSGSTVIAEDYSHGTLKKNPPAAARGR